MVGGNAPGCQAGRVAKLSLHSGGYPPPPQGCFLSRRGQPPKGLLGDTEDTHTAFLPPRSPSRRAKRVTPGLQPCVASPALRTLPGGSPLEMPPRCHRNAKTSRGHFLVCPIHHLRLCLLIALCGKVTIFVPFFCSSLETTFELFLGVVVEKSVYITIFYTVGFLHPIFTRSHRPQPFQNHPTSLFVWFLCVCVKLQIFCT